MQKSIFLAIILLLIFGCIDDKDNGRPQDQLAICKAACEKNIPHSIGSIQKGSCKCPCIAGYNAYNNTCITEQEYENITRPVCPDDHPVLKSYNWSYKSKNYKINLCYETRNESVFENRSKRKDYWNFVDDPYSNGSVTIVTDMLTNRSEKENFSKYEQVEFAIAFVQDLPYTFDNVSTPYDDYPRYPSETIYADGGDCEDTSILMAAILRKMGYGIVLLQLPRHVATGVACNPSDFGDAVDSYQYNGKEYCYLETTGKGWRIGKLPPEFAGEPIQVIPMRGIQPDIYIGAGKSKLFHYAYTYNSQDTYVNVSEIRVDNFGTTIAKNVNVNVALETAEKGKVWSQYTVALGDIPVRGYNDGSYVTNLHAPTGETFRVAVIVYGDNFQTVEARSDWIRVP